MKSTEFLPHSSTFNHFYKEIDLSLSRQLENWILFHLNRFTKHNVSIQFLISNFSFFFRFSLFYIFFLPIRCSCSRKKKKQQNQHQTKPNQPFKWSTPFSLRILFSDGIHSNIILALRKKIQYFFFFIFFSFFLSFMKI